MECTETILLADDEQQIRDLLSHLLISNGYKVVTAVNGQEALQKFTENVGIFDLLVTDIVMPFMDGVRSAEEMKKINPTLKVIFMTGFVENLPPYLHIIYKPFSAPQLLEMVRRILGNKPFEPRALTPSD